MSREKLNGSRGGGGTCAVLPIAGDTDVCENIYCLLLWT